jgi:hypothetical protein
MFQQMTEEDIEVNIKYSDEVEDKNRKRIFLNSATTVASLEMIVRDVFPNDCEGFELVLQCDDEKTVSNTNSFKCFSKTVESKD